MRRRATRVVSIVVAFVAESSAIGCYGDDATSSAPTDGGGVSDASFVDATPIDSATVTDAGAPDVRACPTDLNDFRPAWHPPTDFYQSRCSQSQISGYFEACLSVRATSATCTSYSPDAGANADCMRCMLSADSDPSYGPLFRSGQGLLTVNVAGCIANATGDLSASGCGAKFQALDECQKFACDCPCQDDFCIGFYGACVQRASSSLCAPYASAARCADSLAEAGLADASATALVARCTQPMSFQDYFDSIVPLFCGAAPSADAAAD